MRGKYACGLAAHMFSINPLSDAAVRENTCRTSSGELERGHSTRHGVLQP